jgi:hypothetical protein
MGSGSFIFGSLIQVKIKIRRRGAPGAGGRCEAAQEQTASHYSRTSLARAGPSPKIPSKIKAATNDWCGQEDSNLHSG